MSPRETLTSRLRYPIHTKLPEASPYSVTVAHYAECRIVMQEAADEIDRLNQQVLDLRKQRCEFDCQYTMGDVADVGGSHCPPDRLCQRCQLERERLRVAMRCPTRE